VRRGRSTLLLLGAAALIGCHGYATLYRVTELPPASPSAPSQLQRHVGLAGRFATAHGMLPVGSSTRAREALLGRGRKLLAQFRSQGGTPIYFSVVRNLDDSVDFYLLDREHADETPELARLAADLSSRLDQEFPEARIERIYSGEGGAPLAAP
jgi:hypothetical protein